MNLILLGGNSIANKKWIQAAQKELSPLFQKSEILFYDHWQKGAPLIDLEVEMRKLLRLSSNLGDYCVFAKSYGAMLALKGIYERKISPGKCVFCGTSVRGARQEGFDVDTWLQDFATPTLFIQNTDDPAFSFQQIKEILPEKHVLNFQLAELPGNTHDYDLDKIVPLVTTFIRA